MTTLGRSLDLLLWGLGAIAWGLTVFALTSRFIDPTAGGLLGLAVATSGMAFVIGSHIRDNQLDALTGGSCPTCKATVRMEHRHRRWDPATHAWAAPSTTWDCGRCGYSHAETWKCPQCETQH